MKFTPLKVRSHYSLSTNPNKNILMQSLGRPNNIAETCVLNGYSSVVLNDLGTMSGAISFMKAVKAICVCGKQKDEHEAGKGKCRYKNGCEEYRPFKLKPIIGCDFFVSNETDKMLSNISVIAPNLAGWKSLMRLTSLANSPTNYIAKPSLKVTDFDKSGLICITGQHNSVLANSLFGDANLAYIASSYESAKSLVKDDWEASLSKELSQLIDIFGKENVLLEVNLQDAEHLHAQSILAKTLRWLAPRFGLKTVASTDSYFPNKVDAPDHRLIVCSAFETSLADIKAKMEKNDSLDSQAKFFRSNNYHIPCPTEISSWATEAEINVTTELAERCETYNVFSKPHIPSFSDKNPDELLHSLCKDGWNKLFAGRIPKEKYGIYGDRVKMELNVFKEAGLADYFLIVQDYCRYAREDLKALMSPSRGSCGGSLVACLTRIIDKQMDPIANGLWFERFYNAGRNTKDKISYPDIDCDFPVRVREDIIKYCREKYGHDKVSQMCTFGKMQGKGALKDVLRAHSACSFDEMNKIAKTIQDPSKIAGDLQEKREEEGDASSIAWTIENAPHLIKDWCEVVDGELVGPLAKQFQQAIRLEGINRSQGKHASGLIISSEVLSDSLPMIHDKSTGLQVAGFEMGPLEDLGFLKFDILGLSLLDKLEDIQNLAYSYDGDLDAD